MSSEQLKAPGANAPGAFLRTGILIYPHWDEAIVTVLNHQLQNLPGRAVVLLEESAGSHAYVVEETLRRWADEEELDLILTVGGCMPAPGPSTLEFLPEATLAVLERQMPGLSETMRAYGQEQSELALMDRGVAGIRGRTLVVNLPAGPGPASLFLEAIVGVLPAIIAHLRQEAGAPTLADVLNPLQPLGTSQETHDSSGLRADEFQTFLDRRRSDKPDA